MNKAIIIILLMLSIANGWAQKIEEITHREINIHFNDSSIKATVLLSDKKVKLKTQIDYYWYNNNTIKSNQGDYKGRLLDGNYQVSAKKGALITKGRFKKGCKSGEWKKWNEQGKLMFIETWSNGVREGSYKKYKKGRLVEKGNYKKGLLHGKQLVFLSDTLFSTTMYKKGKVVLKKEKSKKANDSDEKSNKKEKKVPFWKKNKEKDGGIKREETVKKGRKKKEKPKKEKKIKAKKKKSGEKKKE